MSLQVVMKPVLVLCAVSIAVFGCTSTGDVDWTKASKLAGTVLHAVAVNYTGSATAVVDALVEVFTDQKVDRPKKQKYPGVYEYPSSGGPPSIQYGTYDQYPGVKYEQPAFPPAKPTGSPPPDIQYGYAKANETALSNQGWEQWGESFPAMSSGPSIDPGALQIDFSLFKGDGGEYKVLPDGARLRDGVNRPEPGDRFGIAFSTVASVYVYIVSIDATGWAQTLFPYPDVPGFSNPVRPSQPVLLPSERLYGLDDARGIETIFVLVSRTPNRELEAALAPLRGLERSASTASRSAQAHVTVPLTGQRGLIGIVPGAAVANNRPLDRYFTSPGSQEFAFSRWFYHE